MLLPQEIEVFYVIPAIRRELAKALVSKGLKQKEVAKIFDVTEACVSNYFNSKRAEKVKFNKKIMNLIKQCANELTNNQSCFINSIQKICREFREKECLCTLHQELDSHVCGCKGCLK